MIRLLLSKPAIWVYSLIISLAIGIVLHIATIGAEEYSQFDHSMAAVNDAKLLRSIHSFYFPLIVVVHLFSLILIVVKKYKRT